MIKLHDDQKKIIEEITKNPNDNTMISSPSGSGKTYIIAMLTKQLLENNQQPLILAHKKEIREQIKNRLLKAGVEINQVEVIHPIRAINLFQKQELPYQPSHIIIDEAHHTEAKSYQDFINTQPQAVLYGFSATPIRNDDKSLANSFQKLINGLSIKTLIKQKRLAPFIYYAPNVGKRNIASIVKSEHLDFDDVTFRTGGYQSLLFKRTIFADILKTYEKHIPNEQAILFAHSLNSARKYVKTFNEAGYKAKHIHSGLSLSQRNKIIHNFKQGYIKILVNVDIVSEGFDMPDVNNVILARPTNSLIVYMQQAMRALRYKPKKVAKIFDHANNIAMHGALDDNRTWNLDEKDITSESVIRNQSSNQGKIYNSEYVNLTDYKLTKFKRKIDKDFDERVNNLISKIQPDRWLFNQVIVEELIEIQKEYGILPANNTKQPTWVGYMIKKYNIINDVPY